ncbi:MAG: hypothetical protein KHZ27_02555 [Fusobacterium sp.]|nr:hypothetical protein [Fusobacterium sp.]
MLESRNEKCHAIIHSAAAGAGAIGAGLAQLPLADSIPITTIQVGMIISIAKVFDVELTEGAAKGLLGGFATGVVGRNVVGIAFGLVPGFGNILKATTASALTEAVGWAAVKHFENLEEDKKIVFGHGTKAGEMKTKEKYKDIIDGLKDRDYFFVALFRICYYINDNEIGRETIEFLNDLTKSVNPETLNRINQEIQQIYVSNSTDELKYYIGKLSSESKIKLKNLLMDEISNFDTNPKKDIKAMECLRILNL